MRASSVRKPRAPDTAVSCPLSCSDAGRCVSLREAGALNDGHRMVSSAAYTGPWDADRVRGCYCDEGRAGPGCEL